MSLNTFFYQTETKKHSMMKASTYEEPPDDNLYLGIVLTAVVVVTGTIPVLYKEKLREKKIIIRIRVAFLDPDLCTTIILLIFSVI